MGSVRRDGDAVGHPVSVHQARRRRRRAPDLPRLGAHRHRRRRAAGARVARGGAGVAPGGGRLGSLGGGWRWIALFAIVEISLPFPLIAIGEQHVDSSLAAIIIAAAPLLVALLAFL